MTVSSAAIVPPMRREPVCQHLHCLHHVHGHRCNSPWSKSPLQGEPSSATAAHLLLFKPGMQRMAVRSAFTCAVIQALNRNGGNCNHGMGLIWNSFRKEERSSKVNCPWICSPGCLTGPDCSLPSSSSAPFLLTNCLFPGSHSWPQCCHRQSGAPGLPRALLPSLLLGVLAPLSLYMPWKDLCPEPQWRGQQCQKADSCSLGESLGTDPFCRWTGYCGSVLPPKPISVMMPCHWSSMSCRIPQAQLTTAEFGEEPSQRML